MQTVLLQQPRNGTDFGSSMAVPAGAIGMSLFGIMSAQDAATPGASLRVYGEVSYDGFTFESLNFGDWQSGGAGKVQTPGFQFNFDPARGTPQLARCVLDTKSQTINVGMQQDFVTA